MSAENVWVLKATPSVIRFNMIVLSKPNRTQFEFGMKGKLVGLLVNKPSYCIVVMIFIKTSLQSDDVTKILIIYLA